MAAVELRVYLPIPDLGRQFAAYLGHADCAPAATRRWRATTR